MPKKYLSLDPDTLSTIGKASVMGLHMVTGVLVGGGLGWLLDRWLGTDPWLLILFFFFGVAAGFRNVWLDAKRIISIQDRQDAEAAAKASAEAERDT